MKKRTVITTNKSEVWVIQQRDKAHRETVLPENLSQSEPQTESIDIESAHDSLPESSDDEKS
jgi:hypothetical protein